MKSILGLVIAALLCSVSAFADATKISNELVIVKACSEMSKANEPSFSLDRVYDVKVSDSGKTLEVEFKWKDDSTVCKGWKWFKYDGTSTECDACIGAPEGCRCNFVTCAIP